jgi:4-diphosphocytidyl-2-C-methyl-D-erythritol kinase
MPTFQVKSPAKINLYLDVLSRGADNYHNILTLFERINLFDEISFKVNKNTSGIRLWCNRPDIPTDSGNLVYKAAELIRKDFGIKEGLDIKLFKRIPVGGGLGGASGNAGTTLIFLNKLYKLGLSQAQLLRYARVLGADVAFFALNRSFALATGRGDRFLECKLRKLELWHVLVIPKVKIMTKSVYRAFKLPLKKSLTKSLNNVNIIIYALNRNRLFDLENGLFNALEGVSLRKHPVIQDLKNNLKIFGAKGVLMSGSGSAVFGIFNSKTAALKAKRGLKGLKGAEVEVVRTF